MDYGESLSEQEIKIKSAKIINYSLSFLGENAKNAIFYHFMKNKNLRSVEEIIDHIDEFEDFLIVIFGYGATFILPLIVNRLYSQFQIEPQSFVQTSLSMALNDIRRRMVQ